MTAYIGLPTFVVFYAIWKIWKREHTVPLATMDLFSGKREIDEEEERFLLEKKALGPRTRLQKIWDSL
jgi:amino acid transporter